MKINLEVLENFSPAYPLEKWTPPAKCLFLDIETTGFTAQRSQVYLIGCAYLDKGAWKVRQWMAEDAREEGALLEEFLAFSAPYTRLIHFNGSNFDLPFLREKAAAYGLDFHPDAMEGIDLYRRIRPLQKILGLTDCRQKSLEQFMGLARTDIFSGKELIGIYQEYTRNPSEFHEKSLFLHNADDLRGMMELLPMLAYMDFFGQRPHVRRAQAHRYQEEDGRERADLLLHIQPATVMPKGFFYAREYLCCKVSSPQPGQTQEAILRVPLWEGELRYYFANYQDYYYLPQEDTALHKSVARYVDREHRIQATAQTCYVRKRSQYLPQWKPLFSPYFQAEYRSKPGYFELTPEVKRDKELFCSYAEHLLERLLG